MHADRERDCLHRARASSQPRGACSGRAPDADVKERLDRIPNHTAGHDENQPVSVLMPDGKGV